MVFLLQRPADTTGFQAQIDSLRKSIKTERGKVEELVRQNDNIADSLDRMHDKYEQFLAKPIDPSVADSLQEKEIAKGRQRYGLEAHNQSQAVLASSFGNRAFDELKIMDLKMEIQTKVIGLQNGIVIASDSLFVSQTSLAKAQKKEAAKSKLGSFFAGFGGGAFTTLLLLLLL